MIIKDNCDDKTQRSYDTTEQYGRRIVELDLVETTRDYAAEIALKNQSQLIRWENEGPGGGNPRAFFLCENLRCANELIDALYGVNDGSREDNEVYLIR